MQKLFKPALFAVTSSKTPKIDTLGAFLTGMHFNQPQFDIPIPTLANLGVSKCGQSLKNPAHRNHRGSAIFSHRQKLCTQITLHFLLQMRQAGTNTGFASAQQPAPRKNNHRSIPCNSSCCALNSRQRRRPRYRFRSHHKASAYIPERRICPAHPMRPHRPQTPRTQTANASASPQRP